MQSKIRGLKALNYPKMKAFELSQKNIFLLFFISEGNTNILVQCGLTFLLDLSIQSSIAKSPLFSSVLIKSIFGRRQSREGTAPRTSFSFVLHRVIPRIIFPLNQTITWHLWHIPPRGSWDGAGGPRKKRFDRAVWESKDQESRDETCW